MPIVFRDPAHTTIDLSTGEHLIVRNHLNAGENRKMLGGMFREQRDKIDPMNVSPSTIVSYLLDWSIRGKDGKKVEIEGHDVDSKRRKMLLDTLDAMDPEDYNEIFEAIQKHADEMKAEREAEKKSRAGEKTSSAI